MTCIKDSKEDLFKRDCCNGGFVVGERDWAQLQTQQGQGWGGAVIAK